MEKFTKTIKTRKICCYFIILLGAILSVYNGIFNSRIADSHYDEGIVEGFIYGIVIGLELGAVVLLQKYRKALASERALRILYNEQNDERKKLIRSKVGMPLLGVEAVIIIIAAVIASKFSIIMFRTMIGVVMFQLIVAVILKVYYMKKL